MSGAGEEAPVGGAGADRPNRESASGHQQAAAGDVEGLLRRALAPIEPPADLAARVRSTLQSIREGAAEELEGWELAAMRDPRNWVRPALAVVGGTAAAAGLLLLGLHQRRRSRAREPLARGERTAADAGGGTRRNFERR